MTESDVLAAEWKDYFQLCHRIKADESQMGSNSSLGITASSHSNKNTNILEKISQHDSVKEHEVGCKMF